ncbi:MAG: dolichyl-phosphate-mannose--protein O-mannosyl transferase, partial [Pseudanabaena sp.]
NPLLWWLSTLAIIGITLGSLSPQLQKSINIGSNNYLLLGYFANYVPWLIVKRCLFLYHYMSASVFSFIALAWVVYQLLEQKGKLRYLGYGIIATVIISQLFFMPIW